MDKDEAKLLLKGDFGKQLLKAASDYAIPLFWGTEKNDGSWTVDSNGTAFLLDCGEGTFVVTAAHVYEDYLESLAGGSDIAVQLGNQNFRLDERVICHLGHKTLDIATFSISNNEIELLNKTIVNGNQQIWPPAIPEVGKGALFSGFPGQERINLADAECSFGIYAAFTPISSISDRHFGCAFDRNYWIDTHGKGLPEKGYRLWGISGAPVLIVDESSSWCLLMALGMLNCTDK